MCDASDELHDGTKTLHTLYTDRRWQESLHTVYGLLETGSLPKYHHTFLLLIVSRIYRKMQDFVASEVCV